MLSHKDQKVNSQYGNGQIPKLIVVLGPTASGKSDFAVEIAKKFNGEIISADSRQVYRGMDIGTGKVPLQRHSTTSNSIYQGYQKSTLSRRKLINRENKKFEPAGFYKDIPHYLINVADPKRRFTVAQFKKLALKAIKDIQERGKIPIICGGTGFYIQAITDDLQIPEVKPDFKLRAKLENKSVGELFLKLKRLDPVRAATIDPKNPRRLIRALEIIYKTGKPVPTLNPPQPSFKKEGDSSLFKGRLGGIYSDTLFLGLKKSPASLKKLIHKRLLKRFKQGMIEEVKKLRKSGLSWKRLDSFGLEYRWISKYLKGKTLRQAQGITYDEMISRLQKETEHYAKRQMVWFKKYPGNKIQWVKNKNQAQKIITRFLK